MLYLRNSSKNIYVIEFIISFQLFIDNKFVDAKSGKTFQTINPATGNVITNISEGDKVGSTKSIQYIFFLSIFDFF